jgi:uncharacterized membrane protein YvbJ
MPDKKCPNCGLYNPENALRCDCGYDFSSGEMKRSYVPEKKDDKQKRQVVALVLLVLLLLFILFVCYILIAPAIGNIYQNIVTLTP